MWIISDMNHNFHTTHGQGHEIYYLLYEYINILCN